MKMRRLVVLLLVGLLIGVPAACGGRNDEETTPGSGTAGETTDGENTSEEAVPGEEPVEEGDKSGEGEVLEELGGGYVWRREGGIVGFCDIVTVLAGTATVSSCAAEPPEVIGEVTLTPEQAQLVSTWIEDLAPFTHEQKDPATADAMTITLTFEGQGTGEATDDHITAMQALAQDVLRSAAAPNR